jgi:predicted enzyme related to lactoylglutathione lyase
MDQIGLTHISFSVSDLNGVLKKVEEFGGAVVERTVTEAMAMIRDPDGQLLELLSDGWHSMLPPRPS